MLCYGMFYYIIFCSGYVLSYYVCRIVLQGRYCTLASSTLASSTAMVSSTLASCTMHFVFDLLCGFMFLLLVNVYVMVCSFFCYGSVLLCFMSLCVCLYMLCFVMFMFCYVPLDYVLCCYV